MSKQIPLGLYKLLLRAVPPSPKYLPTPSPTTVVMTPLVPTLRMRLSDVSAMYRLPAVSKTTAQGRFRPALVAVPPSPERPKVPFPATVVIMPLAFTLRMRLFDLSAMYRLPKVSTVSPTGPYKLALVACPPSPEKLKLPLPATVVIIPLVSTLRMRLLL